MHTFLAKVRTYPCMYTIMDEEKEKSNILFNRNIFNITVIKFDYLKHFCSFKKED